MDRYDVLRVIALLLNSSSPIVLTVVANYIFVYFDLPSLIIALLDATVFSLTSKYFDNSALEIMNYYTDLLLTTNIYYQILITSATLLGLMTFAILYKSTLTTTTLTWFVMVATDIAFVVKWTLLYFSRIEVKPMPKPTYYQQEHESTS